MSKIKVPAGLVSGVRCPLGLQMAALSCAQMAFPWCVCVEGERKESTSE